MKNRRKQSHAAIFIVIAVAFIAVLILNIVVLFVTHMPTKAQKNTARPSAASSVPDWVAKYPQLGFISKAFNLVSVVEWTGGKLFALDKIMDGDGIYAIELFKVDGKDKTTLVYEYPILGDYIIDSADLGSNGRYIFLDVSYGSPIGGVRKTVKYFDPSRRSNEELYNVSYDPYFLSSVTVTVNSEPEKRTSLISFETDKPCAFPKNFDEKPLPVNFSGISIQTGKGQKRFFAAPVPMKESCEYDEDAGFHARIASLELADDTLVMTTAYGTKISLDLSKEDLVPVFEE